MGEVAALQEPCLAGLEGEDRGFDGVWIGHGSGFHATMQDSHPPLIP